MSEETLTRIFEPFFSTKGITGTGLGLWISREIVGKHGGRLTARSRERREGSVGGTVFSLFLPLVGAAEGSGRRGGYGQGFVGGGELGSGRDRHGWDVHGFCAAGRWSDDGAQGTVFTGGSF